MTSLTLFYLFHQVSIKPQVFNATQEFGLYFTMLTMQERWIVLWRIRKGDRIFKKSMTE